MLVLICHVFIICVFFFFKQKTAYEMRISDWSSDVCSSDLLIRALARGMGMEEPDHLAEPAFAERIWRTSGGVTGNFKRILHWSGKVARRHDRRFVTQDDITEALQLFTPYSPE